MTRQEYAFPVPIPEPVSPAVALAERAALLYCEAGRTLPQECTCACILDKLFDVIADMELVAGGELGPFARGVLGSK